MRRREDQSGEVNMNKIVKNPQVARALAIGRVEAACKRGEEELSELAAPDGTVAVQIDDLRTLLNAYDEISLVVACGKQRWSVCHYGSEPMKGDHIYALTEHGGRGETVAYLGHGEHAHEAAGAIVLAHNAGLDALSAVEGETE
jgi:hypothetical protein